MNPTFRDMAAIVSEHPMFAAFTEAHRELIAGCASNVRFDAGELLFREGEPVSQFYLIRYGKVAVELVSASRGHITIQTHQEGDIVGWSWIVPPFRSYHDARALTLTRALAFDGGCLRDKANADPEFGFVLLKHFSQLIAQSLERVQLQLVDVYGEVQSA